MCLRRRRRHREQKWHRLHPQNHQQHPHLRHLRHHPRLQHPLRRLPRARVSLNPIAAAAAAAMASPKCTEDGQGPVDGAGACGTAAGGRRGMDGAAELSDESEEGEHFYDGISAAFVFRLHFAGGVGFRARHEDGGSVPGKGGFLTRWDWETSHAYSETNVERHDYSSRVIFEHR